MTFHNGNYQIMRSALFKILFFTVIAFTSEKVVASTPEYAVLFNEPDPSTIPACRHVQVSDDRRVTTAPKPEIFVNVKNILLMASADGQELTKLPFLSEENLRTLAACTLQTVLARREPIDGMISSKPIYVVQAPGPWPFPEAKKEGNLAILVQAKLSAIDPKIVLVNVRYFRPEVNDLESAFLHQCSEAIPVSEDQSAFHQNLTKATRICLDKPYAMICKVLPCSQ
jgi:hypothetical protein